MKIIKKGRAVYLECEKLSESGDVIHAFLSRKGGFSNPPFNSLNLSYRVGDNDETVLKNYRTVGKNFGINYEHFITVNQSHGDKILVIDNQTEKIKDFFGHEVQVYLIGVKYTEKTEMEKLTFLEAIGKGVVTTYQFIYQII